MMEQQTKGLCLAPKWILDVVQCEVDRLYQLSKTQIQPISIQVPRRVSDVTCAFKCNGLRSLLIGRKS